MRTSAPDPLATGPEVMPRGRVILEAANSNVMHAVARDSAEASVFAGWP